LLQRGFSLSDVAGWMSTRPARLAGLRGKGQIAPGYDADFCVFAPGESFVVDPGQLRHRHPVTPYTGRTLTGVVRDCILRGQPADPQRPRGRLLRRDGAREEMAR
jgi:allantoinase